MRVNIDWRVLVICHAVANKRSSENGINFVRLGARVRELDLHDLAGLSCAAGQDGDANAFRT